MMNYHTHQQPVGSLRGNQERFDPLRCIELELQSLFGKKDLGLEIISIVTSFLLLGNFQ
jgi:hypothetical protein